MRKNCSNYPVEIAEGVFSDESTVLSDILKKATGAERPRIMLIADQNLVDHTEGLGTAIGRWVQRNGIELAGPPVLVPGGERTKDDTLGCARTITSALLNAKIGKQDAVLVLGGGTVLDVAGWVTAQVRGGVPTLRLPTTPTAMIEAAFADYATVNGPGVKDALRIASRPIGVVIDTNFAQTVLDGVWRAGFAVALRLALVSDAALAKKLMKILPDYGARHAAALKTLVEATVAVRMKKGDTPFALWSAHRLESMSEYKLPYGYAVAIGICIDASYAVMKGAMTEEDRKLIVDTLTASGVMECALRSQHLLGRVELLMLGLDAWRLATGTDSIVIPTGIGKGEVEKVVDRDTMKRAINLLK